MVESNISYIFQKLHDYQLKVNLIQNSAISFSVCIEDKFNNFNDVKSILAKIDAEHGERKTETQALVKAVSKAETDEERMAYATKLAELVKADMFDNSAEEQMVKHQAAKKAMPSIYGEAHGALQQTDFYTHRP